MPEKEGAWAREYRQGRTEQVKQQRIANLIAFAALDDITNKSRTRAIQEAYRELFPTERAESK